MSHSGPIFECERLRECTAKHLDSCSETDSEGRVKALSGRPCGVTGYSVVTVATVWLGKQGCLVLLQTSQHCFFLVVMFWMLMVICLVHYKDLNRPRTQNPEVLGCLLEGDSRELNKPLQNMSAGISVREGSMKWLG